MTQKKLFYIVLFLLVSSQVCALNFSEIMYNPQGSDTGREWIELSDPECIDLQEYALFESGVNHKINPFSDGNCTYPIICNDCSILLEEYNITSATYESSFTLSNSGEPLELRLNGSAVDTADYTGNNATEGESVSLINGSWIASFPTPGYIVVIYEINQTANQAANITEDEINETTNSTAEDITDDITDELVEIVETCNVSVSIDLKEDKDVFYNRESIKFHNALNTSMHEEDYTIEYWIEDIYGNILKSPVQTSNLNQKSYTPSISDRTVVALIKNRIVNMTCGNATNIINGTSEKRIIILNPSYSGKECKKCDAAPECDSGQAALESVLDMSVVDGNMEIDVYRGDDRKYVVTAYAKNDDNRRVTDLMKLSLEKYSGTDILLSLEGLECADYTLFAEGLGFSVSSDYLVKCKENGEKIPDGNPESEESSAKIVEQSQGPASDIMEDAISSGNMSMMTGDIVYESKGQKTKNYSLIGIIVIISGTLIYLSYRKFLNRDK